MKGKFELSNKKGLIFGATGFVGSEVAKNLSSRGTEIILHGKSKDSLVKLEKKLAGFSNKKTFLEFNLENLDLYNSLSQTISKRTNHIDFFINAVGKFPGLFPLTHLSPQMWNELIEINLNSYWRILHCIEPFLKQATNARIIFFTCSEIASGLPFHNIFSVCKSGIETMSKVYREENKNLGLKVHLVSIKPFNQGMTLNLNTQQNENKDQISCVIEKIINKCINNTTDELIIKV
ncbi:MAG: hypothetical protein CMN01_05750 [Rickettsiales bacterium]|nr:hypothetical protein [Rickettsiales bacterium]